MTHLLSVYTFWWKSLHMPVRKRKRKSWKVSNFALLLAIFKRHHGRDGVNRVRSASDNIRTVQACSISSNSDGGIQVTCFARELTAIKRQSGLNISVIAAYANTNSLTVHDIMPGYSERQVSPAPVWMFLKSTAGTDSSRQLSHKFFTYSNEDTARHPLPTRHCQPVELVHIKGRERGTMLSLLILFITTSDDAEREQCSQKPKFN